MRKSFKKNCLLVASVAAICGLASCGGGGVQDPMLQPTIDVSSNVGYDCSRELFRNFIMSDQQWITAAFTGKGEPSCPNKGRAKMLVVPVLYKDNSLSKEAVAERVETVRRAFYGTPEETTWQSVRSYYYESSYHQLYFDGEVSKPVTMNTTYAELASSKEGTIYNTVAEDVYDLLFTNDDSQYKGKEAEWDSDKDGILDAMYMVPLDSPIDGSVDMGWAFTAKHFYPSARMKTKFPQYARIGAYAWSSYQFSQKVASERPNVDRPDAHTYIHETGHILGLNDYYDPSNQGGSTAGSSTMQDHNICDHDIYSKYLWGWVSPKAVTDKNTEETIEVVLKPSATHGDVLLLTSGWNNTAMDEYLLFEYYTPTGLQEHDSKKAYESSDQIGVNASGIRIWHVDKNVHEAHIDRKSTTDKTKITYFDPNPASVIHAGAAEGYKFDLTDAIPEDNHLQNSNPTLNQNDTFYTSFTTNNSSDYASESAAKENFYIRPELQIVRAHHGSGDRIVEADLMKQGDTFGLPADGFDTFEFYSPAEEVSYDISADDWAAAKKLKIPYTVEITSMTDEAATLKLTRVAR